MKKVTGFTDLKILHKSKNTIIYHAIREMDRKTVVLKTSISDTPSQKATSQLLHEYAILQDLSSSRDNSGILTVLDLIYQQRQPILVLDDGGDKSLNLFLAGIPLELDIFLRIALQLVKTIAYIHGKNIIHKDLKPDNIMINTKTLTTKLIDFSISTRLSQQSIDMEVSPEFLGGTFAYMSPEQTGRLNRPIDYRCDFYALGITFFELLTGSPPFTKRDPLEMIYCHLAEPIPLVSTINPKIPEQIAFIVNKLTEKQPEDRYMSSIGIQTDLEECYKQWQKNKSISFFPLAQHDVFDHLHISQKLYGREKQLEQLTKAFERISERSKELVLVSGYSGVGKTSLIKEIYKPITLHRGYFCKGKFDQHQRSIPYSAFTEALEEIIRRLLMETPEKIEIFRQCLLTELKSNGQVIIDIVPPLELIIGPQPPPEPLSSANLIQTRFIITFKDFIRVLAQEKHPLVLFIDDCQWADNASLELIRVLMATPDIHYFLMILAYRDNELIGMHPLKLALKNIGTLKYTINHLELKPLIKNDIQHLLADSFNCTIEDVESLATMLLDKTQGNPFFINEFLKTLYQNEFLKFEHGKWHWDIKRIHQQSYTDNVIDFLLQRFDRLCPTVQYLLQIASCIGHTFDARLLSLITKKPLNDIISQLTESIEENFIAPIYIDYNTDYNIIEKLSSAEVFQEQEETAHYHFTHDKIQQALYIVMNEQERNKAHLSIGWLLKDHPEIFNPTKYSIDICNHLNMGKELITDPTKREELAELNLKAGGRSKEANAYQSALAYFESGIDFLPEDSWEINYRLTFELYHEYAYCQFLTGHLEKAKELFELLLSRSKTDDDRIKILLSESQLFLNQPNYIEAINAVGKVFDLLHYDFPIKPSKLQVIKEILIVEWLLRGKKNEDLFNAPDLTDKYWLLILKTLNSIGLAAVLTDPYLLAMITLRTVKITLHHGNSIYSPTGFLSFGAILLRNRLDCSQSVEDRAIRFSDLSLQLANKLNKKSIKGECYQFSGLAFQFRRQHIRESLPFFQEAYTLSLETANLAYAAYNLHHMESTLFLCGEPIPKLLKIVQNVLEGVNISNGREELGCLTIIKQFHETLLDDKHDHQWTFENYKEPDIGSYPLDNTLVKIPTVYHFRRSFFYYLIGDYTEALKHFEVLTEIYRINKYPVITPPWMIYYFYYPLTLAACYHNLSPSEQKKSKKLIIEFLNLLKSRSYKNPENNLNKYYLIRAELAHLNHDISSAIVDYIQSIKIAHENGFTHEEAIANERCGNLYLTLGDADSARVHLISAYQKFDLWGAKAKTAQMKKQYPDIMDMFERQEEISQPSAQKTTVTLDTFTLSDKAIDIYSVMKATQAVSNEIILDELLNKLLSVLLENAGAQRVVILVSLGKNWMIIAEGLLSKKQIYTTEPKHINGKQDVPVSLIDYVQRTKEPLIIKDVLEEYPLTQDAYLKSQKAKSILILPVLNQDEINTIVYMENNALSGVFTKQQLQTLQFIASQTAISLKNATLFEQATHDPLTGLGNRNLLYSTFSKITTKRTTQNNKIGIIFLDLDSFKAINDNLGHEVGDEVLIYVSKIIKQCIREKDLAVRLGGDEFVILLGNIEDKEKIQTIAERCYKLLEKPFYTNGKSIQIALSVGISIYPDDGLDIRILLKKSDIALYKAKESGKNHYQFYKDSFGDIEITGFYD